MNPFTQKRTIGYQVFEMAKKGTTLKEIEKYAIRKGSNAAGAGRIIRLIRSGEYRGEKWTIIESAGTIQVKETKHQKRNSRSKDRKVRS